MIFDDEFIEKLPVDSWDAIKEVKSCFNDWDNEIRDDQEVGYYEEYLKAFAFLNSFLQKINFKGEAPQLSLAKNKSYQINDIRSFFNDKNRELFKEFEVAANETLFKDTQAKYSAKLGAGFAYEFSDGDLKKVQTSINELRYLISDSEIIEGNHKQRLLKRLERLQSELHKKMSDLDRFWGFVGDAGVVMGKFGKDAKPFTDRIKEIMEAVWNTQARSEELESGSPNPFLKQNNDSDE